MNDLDEDQRLEGVGALCVAALEGLDSIPGWRSAYESGARFFVVRRVREARRPAPRRLDADRRAHAPRPRRAARAARRPEALEILTALASTIPVRAIGGV